MTYASFYAEYEAVERTGQLRRVHPTVGNEKARCFAALRESVRYGRGGVGLIGVEHQEICPEPAIQARTAGCIWVQHYTPSCIALISRANVDDKREEPTHHPSSEAPHGRFSTVDSLENPFSELDSH